MAVVLMDVGVVLATIPLMIGIILSVNNVVALSKPRRIIGIFMVAHLRIHPVMFHVVGLEEAEVVIVPEEGLVLILWLSHPQISFLQHC